jgi:hypothetical protein
MAILCRRHDDKKRLFFQSKMTMLVWILHMSSGDWAVLAAGWPLADR